MTMSLSTRLLSRSVLSLIDQVALSGLNFVIGILLIRLVSKDEYGLYTTLFSAGILASTLLDALVGTTLTTLAGPLDGPQRQGLLARALRLQGWASMGLGGLMGLGTGAWAAHNGMPIPELITLALSFGGYVASLGLREYCRTAGFLAPQADAVLRVDLVFVGTTVTAGLLVWAWGHVSVPGVLTALTLANALASVRPLTRLYRAGGGRLTPLTSMLAEVWPLSRWALPGALVGWLCSYSYLYFAGALAGLSASADLNAARILLIPIGLTGVAWSRVARPVAGSLIARHDWQQLGRLTLISLTGMELVTLAYTSLLVLAFPWLAVHLLGEKYQNVAPLLYWWGAYFVINVARTIGTTWLTSFGHFQALFWQGSSSLLILTAAILWLMPRHGAAGAIMALVLVEAIELITSWAYLLPRARRLARLAEGAAA